MKYLGNKQRGFSLIELVIVIVLLGVVASIGGMVLRAGLLSYLQSKEASKAGGQINLAFERFCRELRRAISIQSPLQSTDITFTDSNGLSVRYYQQSNQWLRSENGGAAWPIADSIASLSMQYANTNLATTSTASDVVSIKISVTFNRQGSSETLSTTIAPRALL